MKLGKSNYQASLEEFSRSLDQAHLSYTIGAFSRLATMASPYQKEQLLTDINDLKQELRRHHQRYLASSG